MSWNPALFKRICSDVTPSGPAFELIIMAVHRILEDVMSLNITNTA